MDGLSALEAKFETYREAFRSQGQRLVIFLSVYRRIHERKHDRLAELNLAPTFFQATLAALHQFIVVSTHALFNGSGSEESLRTFLGFVGRNLSLFSLENLARRRGWSIGDDYMIHREAPTIVTVREDRKRIDRLGGLKSIAPLRNRIHAHLDAEYFADHTMLADEAPLRWQDLTEVRDTLVAILNRYSSAYDANTFEFAPMNVYDLDDVIEILRRYRLAAEREG